MLIIGLTPWLAAVLLWSQHMYTVGLSIDARGKFALWVLALLDVACLCFGLRFLTATKN
ncbi:MAG TPA: hypothetical protein VG798_01240 [Rhizomicrobium sp.]|nr:hypothetical protein [Rhizomicrobium sp.]